MPTQSEHVTENPTAGTKPTVARRILAAVVLRLFGAVLVALGAGVVALGFAILARTRMAGGALFLLAGVLIALGLGLFVTGRFGDGALALVQGEVKVAGVVGFPFFVVGFPLAALGTILLVANCVLTNSIAEVDHEAAAWTLGFLASGGTFMSLVRLRVPA